MDRRASQTQFNALACLLAVGQDFYYLLLAVRSYFTITTLLCYS